MDPLTMGLIGGGASLLGSIFSSSTAASNTQAQIAAQQQMQAQTEQFNAGQAQVQRDYETQMSNTAYQRASTDMKAAGLNPMMMFGSGGPAGTPSVGAASVGTPNVPMPQKTSPLAGLGDAVGKVFSTANAVKDLQAKNAQIDVDRARKANLDSDSLVNQIQATSLGQRSGAITDENASKHAQAVIDQNAATTAANEANINPTTRRISDQAARLGAKADSAISPAVDIVNTLTSSALKKRGLDLLQQRQDADIAARGATRVQTKHDAYGNITGSSRTWDQQ